MSSVCYTDGVRSSEGDTMNNHYNVKWMDQNRVMQSSNVENVEAFEDEVFASGGAIIMVQKHMAVA
jgi:hypothetical protein